MKKSLLYLLIFVGFSVNVACVGTKKYKALEVEKNKLENTLLDIKTNLAEAKLALNKLQDESSLSVEQKSSKITELQKRIALCESVLQTTQKQRLAAEKANENLKEQMVRESEIYQKEFKPLLNIKQQIKTDNQQLSGLKEQLLTAYADNPALKLNILLEKHELTLTFDFNFLFSSTGRSLSEKGRLAIYTLSEVLLLNENVLIEIKGYADIGANKNDNWKMSSRKPLSVLYTLANKGVADERMQVSYYGQYQPLSTDETKANISLNNRTEVVLYYSSDKLLKTIPIK